MKVEESEMVFLDNYLYFITFVVLVGFFTLINVTKSKQWIIKHQQIIALVTAAIQFYVFVEITIFRVIQGGWFHILMTDLCPLISFCSIPIFIWNKEKTYKFFMPWLLIGSVLTILTSGTNFVEEGTEMALNSYFRHSVMFIQGFLAYIWIKKYEKQEYYLILIFPALNLLWVLLVGFIPWQATHDVKWSIFSTGLLPTAFYEITVTFGNNITETYGSYAFLADMGIPYPVTTILFYAFAVGSAFIIVLNKKYFPFYKEKILNFFKRFKLNIFANKTP